MAWVYCNHCNEGLAYPTLREILTEEYICPTCKRNNDAMITQQEALGMLLDKVEELETKLNGDRL